MSVSTVSGRSPDARQAGRVAGLRLGPALTISFVVLYACFLTRNYYWDGLSFAIDIERAQSWRDLLNAHHLLYNLIGYGEYLLVCRRVRALYLMQWSNCLAGGVLIWLAYRLLRSLDVPVANSAACAMMIGAAATYWKFSTDADSYILANVFLLAAYKTVPRATLRGALLHVCAMMMHQLSALFFPVALALLWRQRKERIWGAALSYTVVAVGLTLALYGIAYPPGDSKTAGHLPGLVDVPRASAVRVQRVAWRRLANPGHRPVVCGRQAGAYRISGWPGLCRFGPLGGCAAGEKAPQFPHGAARVAAASVGRGLHCLSLRMGTLQHVLPAFLSDAARCVAGSGGTRALCAPAPLDGSCAPVLEFLRLHLSEYPRREKSVAHLRPGAAEAVASWNWHHIWATGSRPVDNQLFQSAGFVDFSGRTRPRPGGRPRSPVCAERWETLSGLDVFEPRWKARAAIPF